MRGVLGTSGGFGKLFESLSLLAGISNLWLSAALDKKAVQPSLCVLREHNERHKKFGANI